MIETFWLVPRDLVTYGALSRRGVVCNVPLADLPDDATDFEHSARARLDGEVYIIATLDGYLPPTWRDGAVTAISDEDRAALNTDPAWTPPEEAAP